MPASMLDQDPRFRKLSAAEQLQVRQRIALGELGKDPRFAALDPLARGQAAQAVAQSYRKVAPALTSWAGQITDQDRQAFDTGFLGDDPDAAYKSAFILGERLAAGSQDPQTLRAAKGWILKNRLGTESLIVRAAAGAKDAIEVLVGSDDELFNDLKFHTSDYQKLATWLAGQMPAAEGRKITSQANVAGMATAFVETVLLNTLMVGGISAPGLFTKKLWSGVRAMQATAASKSAATWSMKTLPMAIEAAGGGLVDVLRKFPDLVDQGKIYGPTKFFTQLSTTLGEGVAFDFAFSLGRDVLKYMVKPTMKALKGFDLTDAKTLAPFLDAAGKFDTEKFPAYLSEVLSGRVPKELLDSIDADGARNIEALAHKMRTLADVDSLELRTPAGFETFAKAAGFDTELGPGGKIKLFKDAAHSTALKSFENPSEALSWMVAHTDVTNGSAEDLAAVASGRLRSFYRTSAKVSDLSDQQLTTLASPVMNGIVPEANLRAVATEVMRRSNVPGSVPVQIIPETDFIERFRGGKVDTLDPERLFMPATISDQATEEYLWPYFDNWLHRRGAVSPGWAAMKLYDKNLSYPTLRSAVQLLGNGADFTKVGDRYLLKTSQGSQYFDELTEPNRLVTRALVDQGVLTEDDIIKQVNHSTGYVLTKSADPDGIVPTRWVLRDGATGREVDQADDLNKILFGKLEFSPRLPEALAPDLVVTRGGTLVVNRTVAYGPVSSLRGMLDDYGKAETWFSKTAGEEPKKLEKLFPDGSTLTYEPGRAHYALEVPSLGLRKVFKQTKDAADYLDKLKTDFGTVEFEANRKGFQVTALPDGSVGFYNGETLLRARSSDEALKILRDSPDSEAHKNLLPFLDDQIEESIQQNTVKALSSATGDVYDHAAGALKYHQASIKANINSFWKPALSSFEELAKVYNDPSIVEKARQLFLRKRFVSQQSYNAIGALKRVLSDDQGRIFSKGDRRLLGKLLQYDESLWSKASKTLMGSPIYELSPGMTRALRQSRQYLQHMGTYFGIDPLRFLQQYSPHIRQVLDAEGGLADMLTRLGRNEAMERIFGKRWQQIPEVKFLSDNSRLDAFLQANSQSDIMDVLTWYTEHGLKQKYLGQNLLELKGWLKDLADKGTHGTVLERLGSFYAAVSGGESDYAGAVITDASIQASRKIAENLRKLGAVMPKNSQLAKKFEELADASVTTNYLDKLSNTVSYATLGWRPFRAMANLTQFMNTHAVFGHFSEDAIAYVDRAGDKYARQLFSKGILNERIFAASSGDLGSKVQSFLDKSLSWQQNSEYLTRAWTARTVEVAFNEGYDRLSKGMFGAGDTGFKKFLHFSNLDILDDADQVKMLELMKAGKAEAARDLAQMSAVRILMFDYAKENYPMAFKGTMGKLFGKFGVFPVGQVDLYRRMLSASDAKTNILRGLRLTATSLAVYEAFRQVGVNYTGFLAYDALAFGGGPLYQTIQDLLQVGDTGPQGSLARRSLSRNWSPVSGGKANVPRLLVPGALQLNQLARGVGSLANGQPYEALLDVLGAPRDTSWIGPGQLYLD